MINVSQAIIDEAAEDHGRKSPPESDKKSDSKPDVVINMPVPELHSVGGVLVHMPHVCSVCISMVATYIHNYRNN